MFLKFFVMALLAVASVRAQTIPHATLQRFFPQKAETVFNKETGLPEHVKAVVFPTDEFSFFGETIKRAGFDSNNPKILIVSTGSLRAYIKFDSREQAFEFKEKILRNPNKQVILNYERSRVDRHESFFFGRTSLPPYWTTNYKDVWVLDRPTKTMQPAYEVLTEKPAPWSWSAFCVKRLERARTRIANSQ